MKILTSLFTALLGVCCLAAAAGTGEVLTILLVAAATILISFTALKNNFGWAAAACALAFAAIYLLTNRISAPLTLVTGPFLAVLGIYISYVRRLSFRNTLLLCGMGYLVQFLAAAVVGQLFFDVNIITEYVNNVRDSVMNEFYALPSVFAGQGISLPPESFQAIARLYNLVFDLLLIIAPSILIAYCGVFAYITVYCVRFFLKDKEVFSYFTSFSVFRTPLYLLAFFVFIFASQSAAGYTTRAGGILANLLVLLTVYITITGLSTIDFFLRKKFVKTWQRIAFYIPFAMLLSVASVFTVPFANPFLLLFFTGVADSVFDFRKLRRPFRMEF